MKEGIPSFKPYEGEKPYIFVSYSHKDKEVIDDLEKLSKLSFRIWHDAGILSGAKWGVSIDTHLRACSVFIIFISDNAVKSDHVLEEVGIAKELGIPIVPIFLSKNANPGITYRAMLRIQGIEKWKFIQNQRKEEYYTELHKLLTRIAPQTQQTLDLFISYAKEDKERIEPLVDIFKEQGWSVWWDQEIPPGMTYDEEIEEALERAKCVIVIWSEASVNSRWIKTESAEGNQRRILVPVLLDAVKIPLEFRLIQTTQLIGWTGDKNHPEVQKLLNSIAKIAGS